MHGKSPNDGTRSLKLELFAGLPTMNAIRACKSLGFARSTENEFAIVGWRPEAQAFRRGSAGTGYACVEWPAVPPVLPAALLPDGTNSEAGTVVGRPDRAVSGH